MVEFYVSLSFIGVGKAGSVLNSCVVKNVNAIHICLKSIQCRNCSEIPGFSASKVSLLRP